MTQALLLNGPNMNRIGVSRPAEYYGDRTLADVEAEFVAHAQSMDATARCVQSNHEGALIDAIHDQQDEGLDLIVVNPAGLTTYGRSLRSALLESGALVGVVHVTQLYTIGSKLPGATDDVFRDVASVYLAGLGVQGYTIALDALARKI